jgi:hypothetical protein
VCVRAYWLNAYISVSQPWFRRGPPKIIVHIPRNPCLRKRTHTHKETVGGAQRLLQFFQLPDRNFVIFRGIFIILCGISYVLIPLFLSEPVTMFCETLRFRGTLYEEHCPTCLRVLTNVVLFQPMNQVADFHETWYERNVFRYHPASYVLCYFPL